MTRRRACGVGHRRSVLLHALTGHRRSVLLHALIGRSIDWAQTWRAQRLREAAEGEAGRRLAAEVEAVRRRAAA
eukprot:scaffold121668_cov75-Phaeocystis_antarctica.AAC.1